MSIQKRKSTKISLPALPTKERTYSVQLKSKVQEKIDRALGISDDVVLSVDSVRRQTYCTSATVDTRVRKISKILEVNKTPPLSRSSSSSSVCSLNSNDDSTTHVRAKKSNSVSLIKPRGRRNSSSAFSMSFFELQSQLYECVMCSNKTYFCLKCTQQVNLYFTTNQLLKFNVAHRQSSAECLFGYFLEKAEPDAEKLAKYDELLSERSELTLGVCNAQRQKLEAIFEKRNAQFDDSVMSPQCHEIMQCNDKLCEYGF